jgi:hypothetical protein
MKQIGLFFPNQFKNSSKHYGLLTWIMGKVVYI